MKKISRTLAIALMIVSGVIGIAVGYGLTPEYRGTMFSKNDMSLGAADRWVDLRYVNAMIAHHRGAMLLAEQVLKGTQRQELKDLANMILKNEPSAIDELYGWKKEWYKDVRPVSDPVVPNLGNYDEKFDLRFLNALIAHHEAGIRMTEEVRMKSSRTEVLDNADAVESFLTTTLGTFKGWRTEWYSI